MAGDKIRRLGRGLDALLAPTAPGTTELRFPTRTDGAPATGFRSIPLAAITPNPLQPRKAFSEAELAELRSSIASSGLLQPILVRPHGTGFELVAGERRFRAVQSLGWKEIPAQVRELDDQAVLTVALIENLQRSDLNPIEEAEGYQELVSKFSLTQQQVADAVGRDRSTVANTLRLLALPVSVRQMLRDSQLTLGHAKALLGLSDHARMIALAAAAVAEGLTVREVERRVRDTQPPTRKAKSVAARTAPSRPAEAHVIEEALRRKFQTDVALSVQAGGKGDLRFAFYSADDLERLLDLMLGPGREMI
ncbi:MAG: ParB/RepB/Spo0J family partition protein [Gemmatimonadota bacterium]|nr:ParB/RepB/Spo0J family partition protein [Gemmatimonadota bacterium]